MLSVYFHNTLQMEQITKDAFIVHFPDIRAGLL